MDLNWLRDFECLARTQNFTRAAEERNITQSAFSRRIKALESWVGLPLVNRATYPIQITEAGRQFLPIALGTVSQLSETRQSIRDSEGRDNRFVRFSVLHTISTNYLVHRLVDLQRDIADLRTRVISDSLSTCCELLVEGAVDIMLCYYHSSVLPRIDDTIFSRRDLLMDRLIPVAATEQVKRHGWDLSALLAAPIPYLAYEHSSFLGMVVDSITASRALDVEIVYVDGLVETIKRRVLNGTGFAWLPETAIATELKAGELTPIGDASWSEPLAIAALTNLASLTPQTRALWERL